MGMSATPDAAERPTTALSRISLPWLLLVAAVRGFGLSVALTALLPANLDVPVGEWGALAVFLAGGIPLAIIDARTFRLPNRGTFPLAAGLAGYWFALALATGEWGKLLQAVICALAIAAVALLIGMLGTLAFGDIKLMLAIGLLTGWVSWILPLYALVAGYFIGIPHASVLLARKKRGGSTHLAFGPYLAAGAVAVFAASIFFAA